MPSSTKTCYSQKILLTWNERSAKTNVPHRSMQQLSRRPILTPNRRPAPDLHRRPIYIDENGNLYDQDGHLRNATGQKLDAQGNRSGNQGRNINFYGNGQRSNQSSKDPDGHARAMDGRILQVSREDIADILQLANGPDNLFMQQRSIPDNIPAVPDEHPRADTIEIGSHQSCQPVGQTSIDKDALTSFDKAPSPSIDRRYECGRRAYDIYGARKFRWEQKDEFGVYRDESEYARSVAEHATSITPTKLAPEIYTKDEINEMVTGICGAQEKLGDGLKTLVDDTYQPLD
ncbi:hypothetical protein DY000_02048822 [Brassica cretica]|uniref:Uncharacterized protein n=1 Tax=Brassica cretica TaxID=69181 RepID=A0ABQ7FA47_BRACR|nr:hypothetical protein DY000_02048822 [Brassica cretica]